MGIFADIAFGNALTKLTNLFEEIERTKRTHFIGAGGGIDPLPISRQRELEQKLPKWMATISSRSQDEVTRELLKNIKLSQNFNRTERIKAQVNLLQRLVDNGIALDVDVFLPLDAAFAFRGPHSDDEGACWRMDRPANRGDWLLVYPS